MQVSQESNLQILIQDSVQQSDDNLSCEDEQDNQVQSQEENEKGKKGAWTCEEDIELKDLVQKFEAKNWGILAQKMKHTSRSGKSCRLRWKNSLCPTVNKSPFTDLEDAIIVMGYERFNSRWAKISKRLNPGGGKQRTDNSVKNHWNSKLKSLYDTQEIFKSNQYLRLNITLEELITIAAQQPQYNQLMHQRTDALNYYNNSQNDSVCHENIYPHIQLYCNPPYIDQSHQFQHQDLQLQNSQLYNSQMQHIQNRSQPQENHPIRNSQPFYSGTQNAVYANADMLSQQNVPQERIHQLPSDLKQLQDNHLKLNQTQGYNVQNQQHIMTNMNLQRSHNQQIDVPKVRQEPKSELTQRRYDGPVLGPHWQLNQKRKFEGGDLQVEPRNKIIAQVKQEIKPRNISNSQPSLGTLQYYNRHCSLPKNTSIYQDAANNHLKLDDNMSDLGQGVSLQDKQIWQRHQLRDRISNTQPRTCRFRDPLMQTQPIQLSQYQKRQQIPPVHRDDEQFIQHFSNSQQQQQSYFQGRQLNYQPKKINCYLQQQPFYPSQYLNTVYETSPPYFSNTQPNLPTYGRCSFEPHSIIESNEQPFQSLELKNRQFQYQQKLISEACSGGLDVIKGREY